MSESRQDSAHRPEAKIVLTDFDAFLFDMDGVITQSMRVHARAWKMLFDTFLRERAEQGGAPFQAFDLDADYRAYVDGKPRYEGVESFLASRGISLPRGTPTDPPGHDTVCALGNKKNRYFQQEIESKGVDVYASSVQLMKKARAKGVKTAIVSSSKNCQMIIESVGIAGLVDTRVDGMEVERLGLPGKPAPDMFLEAAKRLQVPPSRAIVFEDAISGVQAGHAGGFGLVVGVDRTNHPEDLESNGADLVVSDLGELSLV